MKASFRLFRTSVVRLAFGYTALFLFAVLILFGFIYVKSTAQLLRQTDETIQAEIQGLSEQYASGGIARLAATVRGRSRRPGDGLYFVGTIGGGYVVGNLDRLPEVQPAADGWLDFTITRPPAPDGKDGSHIRHAARARLFQLAEGAILLVGRDIQARKDIERILEQAAIWGLVATLVLGIAGGLLAGHRMLSRVEAAGNAAREIVMGDLTGRLPLSGSGDELDRLSATFNSMLDRLERLMAGLQEVSDNIAHDLRTPLTRIRAEAENAARSAASLAEAKSALSNVIEETDRLLKTFSALLAIAQLDAGSYREQFQEIDLSAMLADLAELYEPVAREAEIGLDIDIEPGARVAADRSLLAQAVVNLIENALHHGQAAISISLHRQADQFAITIADRGAGVPVMEQVAVLERFVRLDRHRSGPGAGLGLSLARAIAEAHGGAISLSDNQPGLRATITLPAP
jgi:signal transduction histidine kinase